MPHLGRCDVQAGRAVSALRATNARQRAVKGTGLGLAICRAIVEGHRGWITVHSEPGAGAAVAVRAPLEQHCERAGAKAA
jgi:signal transduction histidine kinase